MAEVGPDGNVWVIDWYNYIVQHNPTPDGFQDRQGQRLRNRPARQDARPHLPPRLRRGPADRASLDLTQAQPRSNSSPRIKTDNLFWRARPAAARRTRKTDVVPALLKLLNDESIDEIGLNVARIHALWTLHGSGCARRQSSRCAGRRRRGFAASIGRRSPQRRSSVAAERCLDRGNTRRRPAGGSIAAGAVTSVARVVRHAAARRPEKRSPASWHVQSADDRWLADAATCVAASNAVDFLIAAAEIKSPSSQVLETCKVVANHFVR